MAEVEQNPDNSHAWVNLAHASTATGGEDAVALYGRAIAGYTRTDDPSGLVPAHVALAIHLSHQGAGSEAVQAQLASARAVAEASGDPLLGAMVDSQEARVIWRQGGDMGRAYTLVRSAEQHAFPDGPYQLKLVVLHVLAGICEETRRLDEGHAASQRMVALTAESGDRYVEATARLNLAAFALNNPERTAPGTAERESMLAIEAAEAAGNPYVLAGALCTRADVLFQSGQPSLPWWRRCEAAYRALDEPGMSAMGTLGEAAVLADSDGLAALALAHRVVAVGRDTGDEGLEVLGRLAVAGLTWAVEGPDAGRTAFVAHHAAAERLVDHQNDATSRAEVMSNWVDGHHMLAALLNQEGLGSIDLTIAEVERVRARELADALRSEAILSAGDPVAVEGLQELGKRLSALNIALAEATVDERPALARQREVLEYDEAVLRDSLQRSVHPTGLAAPTLAELQAELEDGEVLLSLQTPPVLSQLPTLQAAPWALAISRTQVGVAQLADRRTLDAAVQTFSGLHQDGGVSAATAQRAAASLWSITVGPALAALGDDPLLGEGQLPRRIIVVPDGPLHDLPFAALRATPEGPPLGTTVDVSRTPSLTSWLALRRSSAVASGPVLVLGDPTWPSAAGMPLPPLPAARQEAAVVSAALGGVPWIGADAQEALLHNIVVPPAVVHLAAHGREEAGDGAHHALILGEGGGHDGVLEAREVRELPLGGTVVVLSACQGASGRVIDGDGLDGLSRAFLLAGAPVVVGSLWPLPDGDAAAFFAPFAQALAAGVPVDTALRSTRAALYAAGAPEGSWAGMVAIGDAHRGLTAGRVRAAPGPSLASVHPSVWLGVMGLGLGFMAVRTRRL